MAGDGVIQRVGENIVPFADIILVEGQKGEIQEDNEQDREDVVMDILR
jgi:hypothetical protein